MDNKSNNDNERVVNEDIASWLDDYVQDRLNDENKARFEAYVLDKPEMLEQIQLGLAMRRGFEANEGK